MKEKFFRYLAQTSEAPLGIVVEEAEGCWLTDAEGRRYLDLISGIAVANLGHRHPVVEQAVSRQIGRYWHVHVYGEMVLEPQVLLAEKLCTLVMKAFERATGQQAPPLQYYPTNSGTEANEGALKLARKFTGRKKFIAFVDSYHGDTFGSLSVTGREVYRRPFQPLLADVTFLPYGEMSGWDVIDTATAAVIAEPVQGEAGIIVPPSDFFAALRHACDRAGALLILDEVQTAFGRTGRWFAFEHWGIRPDILTVGKALGGGLPIGGFIAPQPIMATLSRNPPLSHVTTFGGHPVASAAAHATLCLMERDDLPAEAEKKGRYLGHMLISLKGKFSRLIRDVRGIGLMWGLELASDELCDRFLNMSLSKGLLFCRTLHGRPVIRISPPLIIGEGELASAVAVMEGILNDLAA